MKIVTCLLALSLVAAAAADSPPESVVEALYRADLSHYGNPSRWTRPRYVVVPYQDRFFASTDHGARQEPYTHALWEYVQGRWSYIFEVEQGPGDPLEYYYPRFRPVFARNGFSEQMMHRLLNPSGGRHPFPEDLRGYSPDRKKIFGLLRGAVRRKHPKADDPDVDFHLLPFQDGKLALLSYSNSGDALAPELWRYAGGTWRYWMTVPDPWQKGAEGLWVAAGVPAGLRSRLILSPSLELPYYP